MAQLGKDVMNAFRQKVVIARQKLEKRICTAVVDEALLAGYALGVDDGGDQLALTRSRDRKAILKALFNTDEDLLLVYRENGDQLGWVRFIYGNDGWDVICDYTLDLESIMGKANKIIEKYS